MNNTIKYKKDVERNKDVLSQLKIAISTMYNISVFSGISVGYGHIRSFEAFLTDEHNYKQIQTEPFLDNSEIEVIFSALDWIEKNRTPIYLFSKDSKIDRQSFINELNKDFILTENDEKKDIKKPKIK